MVDEDVVCGFGELGELQGEGAFGGVGEGHFSWRGEVTAELAEDGTGADVGVDEVGCGVALEGEHFVPTKLVVCEAVLGEFGILDGADADDFRDGGFFFVGEAFAVGDDGGGAFDGFVEDFDEANGFAGASAEHFAVLTEDATEGDVDEVGLLAAFAGGFEDLTEMEFLGGADDIPDFVGFPDVDAVIDGGEVGGGVEEATVGFADDAGFVSECFDVAKEDAGGAVADFGDALGEKVIDERGELVVVGAFAEVVVEVSVELGVDGAELVEGEGDATSPDLFVFGVALLKFDELESAGIEHGGIGLGFGVDGFVKAKEFGDGVGVKGGGVEQGFPAVKDHAELGSPVADVVVGNDFVADEACDARERVANEGGADVAYVRGFGDVGRGEIDDDGVWCRNRWDTEVGIGDGLEEVGGECGWGQGEVEEAGTVDAGFFAKVGGVEGIDDLLSECAGVGAHLLGENHGGIRLVIAIAGVRGEDNGGGEVVWHSDAGFFEGSLEALGEEGTEHGDYGMRNGEGEDE